MNLFHKAPRNKKILAISAAIAAVLMVGTATIVYAVTTSNAHNRGVIMFVGDSNITLGAQEIENTLADNNLANNSIHLNNSYVPVFLSRSGARVRQPDCINVLTCTTNDYWKLKLAATLPKVKPDAVVVDLGINDITFGAGTATTSGYGNYGQKIDYLMALLPTNKPVIWTNLPCQIEPSSALTGCHAINLALSQAHTRWANIVVPDWASVANNHVEYMRTDSPIHYNDAGYAAWSKLVVNALDARFPIPAN